MASNGPQANSEFFLHYLKDLCEGGAGISNKTLQEMAVVLCQRGPTRYLLQALGLEARDPRLWLQALTHSSFAHEFSGRGVSGVRSNERMEFLGDALLSAFISRRLYERHPDCDEGHLSKLRGAIVNEEILAELGRLVGLPSALLVGRGEALHGAMGQSSLVADAMEAVLAAAYLEGGQGPLDRCLETLLKTYEKNQGVDLLALERLKNFDPKTQLQEFTMKHFQELPRYEAESLPNGAFQVSVWVRGEELARMEHASKKKAIKAMAKRALDHLQQNHSQSQSQSQQSSL